MSDALVVENLNKIYGNGLVALKKVNLNVKTGDFFALLGPNGAGKSTTISILCSLIPKTAGRVSIFGYDIDTNLINAKSHIGIVPQEINFNFFENILQILIYQAGYYGIPRKIAKQRAEIYLKKLGLWEKRTQAPRELSGGLKRRLMIARALMNTPQLLILDEPTAGVDIELRHSLWEFLKELNQQGTTIILTTHYLEEAEHLCKNIAIIDRGEIIAQSDMKSFMNQLAIQTLVLELEKPLTIQPNLPDYPYRIRDTTTLEVDILKGHYANNLFELLSRQNIQVHQLHNKTNRLEEIFIQLIKKN